MSDFAGNPEAGTRQFISYPKSGRTWLRYALTELHPDIPIEFHHDGFEFNDGSRPAHDFQIGPRLARYDDGKKLVYLERDPRDVMVSLYHQVTGRFRDYHGYQGDISAFIRDEYFGAHILAQFRQLWADLAKRLDVLVVSYEECHQNFTGVLLKVGSHLGLTIRPAEIKRVATKASFQAMKKLELSASFPEPWLRPRNDALKMREGKVGNYRKELSSPDIVFVDELFGAAAPAPRSNQ